MENKKIEIREPRDIVNHAHFTMRDVKDMCDKIIKGVVDSAGSDSSSIINKQNVNKNLSLARARLENESKRIIDDIEQMINNFFCSISQQEGKFDESKALQKYIEIGEQMQLCFILGRSLRNFIEEIKMRVVDGADIRPPLEAMQTAVWHFERKWTNQGNLLGTKFEPEPVTDIDDYPRFFTIL